MFIPYKTSCLNPEPCTACGFFRCETYIVSGCWAWFPGHRAPGTCWMAQLSPKQGLIGLLVLDRWTLKFGPNMLRRLNVYSSHKTPVATVITKPHGAFSISLPGLLRFFENARWLKQQQPRRKWQTLGLAGLWHDGTNMYKRTPWEDRMLWPVFTDRTRVIQNAIHSTHIFQGQVALVSTSSCDSTKISSSGQASNVFVLIDSVAAFSSRFTCRLLIGSIQPRPDYFSRKSWFTSSVFSCLG